jgi:ApaG protein
MMSTSTPYARATAARVCGTLNTAHRTRYGARVSTAVTQGIRVDVKTQYLSERSSPMSRQYVFAYTIRITNEGTTTAQLRSRHWIITDADGKVQEVRGDGVIGAQPTLRPGQHFEYTSGCVLATARGAMRGTYQMVREDGTKFDATVAEFPLAMPHSIN